MHAINKSEQITYFIEDFIKNEKLLLIFNKIDFIMYSVSVFFTGFNKYYLSFKS